MTNSEKYLIVEIHNQIKHWSELAATSMKEVGWDTPWTAKLDLFRKAGIALSPHLSEMEIEALFREVLLGFAHSILVGIDGGSRLADTTRLKLIDQHGEQLCSYLHELLAELEPI